MENKTEGNSRVTISSVLVVVKARDVGEAINEGETKCLESS